MLLSQKLWNSAVQFQDYLRGQAYDFCFIGGVAVQRWGQPRMTDDLDLTLVTEFGSERAVARDILGRYQSRHPNPLQFAIEARILLLQDIQGVDIDLSLGGMPFEERMIQRSSLWKVAGLGTLQTCSAEDLVILKSFASRPQDWIDVKNVLIRQNTKLDRRLVLEELTPLVGLKEEPEILDRLNELFLSN